MFDPSASRTSFAILTDACGRGKVAPLKYKVKEAQKNLCIFAAQLFTPRAAGPSASQRRIASGGPDLWRVPAR